MHIHEACDESKVVFTIAKKTCLLYDVELREPLSTWSCKPREQLTCGAVYDSTFNHYAVIVNAKAVRIWKFEELDAAEKIHFTSKLHCLVSSSGSGCFLVFGNGHVELLQHALRNPKEIRDNFLASSEQIVHCDVTYADETQVGIIAKDDVTKLFTFGIIVFDSSGTEKRRVKYNLDFHGGKTCLLKSNGLSLLALGPGANVHIFKPCPSKEKQIDRVNIKFPFGIGDVETLALDYDHVAVMEQNFDGTKITLWDLRYNVAKACRQISSTKSFKLWGAARCLFFTAENKVHSLPFSVEESLLSSVVGSNSVSADDVDVATVVAEDWMEETIPFNCKNWKKKPIRRFPPDLRIAVQNMLAQGQSTDVICRHVYKSLVQKNDLKAIVVALQVFGEAPEDIMVQLLDYFLCDGSSDETENPVLSSEDAYNVNLVLNLPFNDVQLLASLQKLALPKITTLLKHLRHCLDTLPYFDDGRLTCFKVMDWLCILFDSQFHVLVLCRDENIKKLIQALNASMKKHFQAAEELEKIETLVTKLSLRQQPMVVEERFLAYSISVLKIQ